MTSSIHSGIVTETQSYSNLAEMVSLIHQGQKTWKVRGVKDYVISSWPRKISIIKLLGLEFMLKFKSKWKVSASARVLKSIEWTRIHSLEKRRISFILFLINQPQILKMIRNDQGWIQMESNVTVKVKINSYLASTGQLTSTTSPYRQGTSVAFCHLYAWICSSSESVL